MGHYKLDPTEGVHYLGLSEDKAVRTGGSCSLGLFFAVQGEAYCCSKTTLLK